MPDHQRDAEEDDHERILKDLARYDADRDQIAVGPPENNRAYDIAFARRLRDALTATIREVEGERWGTIWVDDDMWSSDSGGDGDSHGQ